MRLLWPDSLDRVISLSQLNASPTSPLVAVVATGWNPGPDQSRLLVVSLYGVESVVTSGASVRLPRWHPEHPRLAAVVDGRLHTGTPGESWVPHPFRASLIEAMTWLPGSSDLVLAARPFPDAPARLLQVADGVVRELFAGTESCADLAVDPTGHHLAFVVRDHARPADAARGCLLLLDVASGHVEHLGLPFGSVRQLVWAADGRLAGIGRPLGDGHWSSNHEAFVVEPASPRGSFAVISPPELNAGKTAAPDSRAVAWFGDDVVFVAPDAGCLKLWLADSTGERTAVRVAAPVGREAHVTDFCVAADANLVTADTWLDQLPTVRRMCKDGSEQLLLDPNRQLAEDLEPLRVARRTSRAADGTVSESFVVNAPWSRQNAPVVVSLHGKRSRPRSRACSNTAVSGCRRGGDLAGCGGQVGVGVGGRQGLPVRAARMPARTSSPCLRMVSM